jgi:isoquinoline 1-oxidoreductase subunit beta
MDTIERKPKSDVSRRHFLVGTAAAGAGLTIGYVMAPRILGSATEAYAANNYSPTMLYTITPAGEVIVHVNKSEMGQHVGTALAQEIAEELEVEWKNMRLDYPDFTAFFTGGSLSILSTFMGASQAGAAGRMALIDAGAKQLGVKASDCHADKGWVIAKGGKKISYAQLVSSGKVDKVFKDDDLKKIAIKHGGYKILGKPLLALDIPAKTNGRALFGIDFFADNMLYGKIARPPVRIGAKPKKGADGKELIDDSEAKKVPGYVQYVSTPDPLGVNTHYVIVLADNFPAAMKAAHAMKIEWDLGPNAHVSSDDILNRAKELVADPNAGGLYWLIGDPKKAYDAAPTKFDAEFITPLASHVPIEPMNALAFFDKGQLHLFSGSQLQAAHQPMLAGATGLKPPQVVIHQMYLGGGFGRRLDDDDVMIPAALASKAVGRPVKIIYTRDEDLRNDFYRSITYQRLRAGIDKQGNVVALRHDVCMASSAERAAPNLLTPSKDKGDKYKVDGSSMSGADSWYGIPNYGARDITNDLGQRATPPGFLRSVSTAWTFFALESFLDELARKTGKDPVELRLSLLTAKGPNAGSAPMSVGGAERIAAVIKKAAKETDFHKKHGRLGPGRGIGLAATTHFRDTPTWTCGIAEVAVDKQTGVIKIEKFTTAIDLGLPINTDGALSQCEGGTLFGLSLAMYEEGTMHNGLLDQTNFDTYTPIRMAQVPDIAIHILANGNTPVGVGEPAVTVVAPAVSNAVYDAVGIRLRRLPFTPTRVKEALKA